MKIRFLLIVLLLIGCSSIPKKDYRVNNYDQASLDFIKLADRKRQQESYSDAIELYLKAEVLALKGNKQKTIGISKLKRALIDLVQNNLQSAQTLISEVEESNQIEGLGLSQPINFVKSKVLIAAGDKDGAFILLTNLENQHQFNIEKHAYYKFVRWSYDYQQIEPSSVQKIIDSLTIRYQEGNLNNIEILSFVYMEHARWAMNHSKLEQGEKIIQQSIDHFSLLELSPKIAKSFKFASVFYSRHNKLVKSEYYLTAYQKLMAVNLIN